MMTTEEWNDKPTGSNNGRTIIGQTAIDAEKDATIARLTAELEAAQERQREDVKINDQIAADVVKWKRRAEAAEALLGAAYRAALVEAAGLAERYTDCCQSCAGVGLPIRALTPPADLAARLGGAE